MYKLLRCSSQNDFTLYPWLRDTATSTGNTLLIHGRSILTCLNLLQFPPQTVQSPHMWTPNPSLQQQAWLFQYEWILQTFSATIKFKIVNNILHITWSFWYCGNWCVFYNTWTCKPHNHRQKNVSLYINCKEMYTVSLCFPQTPHCVTNAIFYFSASLTDKSVSILTDLWISQTWHNGSVCIHYLTELKYWIF